MVTLPFHVKNLTTDCSWPRLKENCSGVGQGGRGRPATSRPEGRLPQELITQIEDLTTQVFLVFNIAPVVLTIILTFADPGDEAGGGGHGEGEGLLLWQAQVGAQV